MNIGFDENGAIETGLSLRDLLKSAGAKYNNTTNSWEIKESSYLDSIPTFMQTPFASNGAMYAVKAMKQKDHLCINVDNKLTGIDTWASLNLNPGSTFKMDDKEWMPIYVDEEDPTLFHIMEFDVDKFATRSAMFRSIDVNTLKNILEEQ